MKIRANLLYDPGPFLMDSCQIEKVLELSARDFSRLVTNPLCNWPCIVENRSHMFTEGGVVHCLLALGKGSADGVLINSEGPAHRLRAAYVPGMRDIINAEMDRAADFIVRQSAEKSTGEISRVQFEKLEKHLGLTIREGSRLDIMLEAALKRRPEVDSVNIHDGCIEIKYHPEYLWRLNRLNRGSEDELPGLRVKDVLPLLKGGMTFLCHEEAERSVLAENLRLLTKAGREDHAALLNAHVASINDSPEGMEVVLTDVDPKELVRFNEAYDAFMEAEQTTGPMM